VVQEMWGFGLVWLEVRHWSFCEQCDRLEKEDIGCVIMLKINFGTLIMFYQDMEILG
jgi:hypothetical protein